jgi:hypothetical protein
MNGPVEKDLLLEPDGITSTALGAAHQPPEILAWLDDLRKALVSRQEFVKTHLNK